MAYNYLQEGAVMFSPHLPHCPPHNTNTLQSSLSLRIPVRPKIQKNSLIFNCKITFTSLHHTPLKPFTNKIGTNITNMQCQAFENQGFFKTRITSLGMGYCFHPPSKCKSKEECMFFIFFSQVPLFPG